MHASEPCPGCEFYDFGAANVMMFSTEKWGAKGRLKYERKPVGTGPYNLHRPKAVPVGTLRAGAGIEPQETVIAAVPTVARVTHGWGLAEFATL